MRLTFSKENSNIDEIELSILEETRDYESLGRSKKHPIHYKVIANVMGTVTSLLKGTNYDPILSKLWISKDGGIYLKNGVHPDDASNYLIERVYARIDLNNVEDHGQNMAIGLLFSEKGYNAAFGLNVRECTNFTVFGDHFYSTFGGYKKADHNAIQELLYKWTKEINVKRSWYYELIKRLKERFFEKSEIDQIIGQMLRMAAARNRGMKLTELTGLDQTQVTEFSMYAHEYFEKHPTKMPDAWQVINWGTQLLKPRNSHLPDLQADLHAFNDYFIRNFVGLTPEDIINAQQSHQIELNAENSEPDMVVESSGDSNR